MRVEVKELREKNSIRVRQQKGRTHICPFARANIQHALAKEVEKQKKMGAWRHAEVNSLIEMID